MFYRRMTLAAFATLATVATGIGPIHLDKAYAACAPGEKIDGSTSADAKKRIEQAGYRQVRDLRKGCDNVWHASATKDGSSALVAVAPSGQVVRDGD